MAPPESVQPPDLATMRTFTVGEIRAIAMEAVECRLPTPRARLEALRDKYPEFWFRYPTLLEMCCSGTMDLERLSRMLGLLGQVSQGTTNLESASSAVQEDLAAQYLPEHLRREGPP